MDALLALLKLGCEVHVDAMPSVCPRRGHTYELEAYHQRTQTVAKTSKPHLSLEAAASEVLVTIRASL